MEFELSLWDVDEPDRLTDFYNLQIRRLPYCFPVTPDEFTWGISHDRYEDVPHNDLEDARLFVAHRGDSVCGFVHVDTRLDNRDRTGIIRFLSYTPGNRNVGQALLDAAESHFLTTGVRTISAFDPNYSYRFYFLGHGISSRLNHVAALFELNGYGIRNTELLLSFDTLTADDPAVPIDGLRIDVHEIPGFGSKPGMDVIAYDGKEQIGTLLAYSLGQRMRSSSAQNTCFIRQLEVDEAYQRKGLGRFLLQKAHFELKRKGYTRSLIFTFAANHRARLFYTNYCYEYVDSYFEFEKVLR